jgi:uncharacterized protein (UPF0333 family)/anti-sigma regulatory factor (Ser/Thr protein kinase)
MSKWNVSKISSWSRLATDKSVLQPIPIIGIILNTTFIHIMTSIDIGFDYIAVRILLAILSVLPLFIMLFLAHQVVIHLSTLQVPIIFSTYVLGGGIRGYVLEEELILFNILNRDSTSFRTISGAIIVIISASVISFVWATFVNGRAKLEQLAVETAALSQALIKLKDSTASKQFSFTYGFTNRIKDQLLKISTSQYQSQPDELNKLIENTIKPLSKEFARSVSKHEPTINNPEMRFRDVWYSIDPIKHLPKPTVAALTITFAGSASLISIFGFRNAVELISYALVTLSFFMWLGYQLAKKFLVGLRPPIRDVVITLGFFLISIPPSLSTRFALADTDNPDAYVVQGLIMLPLFGWLIMTGSAAWQQLKDATEELSGIQHQLKWSIARINLLSWYYNGLASRLLHGPIQNSVQVAAIRMQDMLDSDKNQKLIDNVITRIDQAVKNSLLESSAGNSDLTALSEIVSTWQEIARIDLHLDVFAKSALAADPPCASITLDLVQEYCSNAIRHGGVRGLNIDLSLAEDALLIEITSDEGSPNLTPNRTGLGSEFISAVTLGATLTIDENGTRIRALVPILMGDKIQ